MRFHLYYLAVVVLAVCPSASAQSSIIARPLIASTVGDESVRSSALVGGAAAVRLTDNLEVFGEWTDAPGLSYPPPQRGSSASLGPPAYVLIAVVEQTRYDRLMLLGGRIVAPPLRGLRPFGEVAAGWVRIREVLWFSPSDQQTISTNEPSLMFGGGLSGRLGRIEPEAGVRFGFVSTASDYTTRIASAHGGFGIRF